MSLIIRKGDIIYHPKYMLDKNFSIQLQKTLQIHPTHVLIAFRPTNGLEFKLCNAGCLEVECIPQDVGRMGLMLLPQAGMVSVAFDIDSEDSKNLIRASFYFENTVLAKDDMQIYGRDIGIEQIAKAAILDGLSPMKAMKKAIFYSGYPDIEIVKTKMSDLLALFNKEEKNED